MGGQRGKGGRVRKSDSKEKGGSKGERVGRVGVRT